MVKLKKIYLKNYCGYKEHEFDFTESKFPGLNILGKKIKPLACFCGPNGCGKSTLLQAIETICNVYRYTNYDTSLLFRKCTYSSDYDPSYFDPTAEIPADKIMEMTGVFKTDDGDKEVVINTKGVQKNELPRKDRMAFHYFIDADSPLNSYKFQLHAEMKDRFLELAELVYGLKCYMGSGLPDLEDAGQDFYTDFIVEKKDIKGNITKVHFKSFSGGERKIATLLRDLCNPIYMEGIDIILIDNLCKEIYFTRHARMVKKIMEIFKNKQIFVTTHSAVLVGLKDEEMGINIPSYLPDKYLYNIDEIK
jgi:AAA15 family ATPase/GTPase